MASKPIYISRKEGGERLPFPQNRGGTVHAVWFADGTVFDAYNGWRPPSKYYKPRIRVPMGRAVV